MTTDRRDELVRQVANKHKLGTSGHLSRVDTEDALREMYSLARAETAKEVIEAAAKWAACFDTAWGESLRKHLASRYAETPKGGVA